MWRTVLVGLLLAIGAWLAIDALVVTDLERVEAEVERLIDHGRQGGEEAGNGILAALADDYRGAGMYSRENLEGYVRRFVVLDRAERIETGGYEAVPAGDGEIVVPILRITAHKRGEHTALLRVTFAERGDRFRIVNVESMRLER